MADLFYVQADEVGAKVLGYTIWGSDGSEHLCFNLDQVGAIVGDQGYWFSLEDAMVHYTRQTDEEWGYATQSVRVRYWDRSKGDHSEASISRCTTPWYRYDDIS